MASHRPSDSGGADYWIFDTGVTPRLENLQRGAFWLRLAQQQAGVVVYMLVTSIEDVLKRAVGLGGKVIAAKTAVGTAFRAFIADPDGNVLGLWEEGNPI